ncbi:MAG: hypothetical protein V1745_01150 [Patescibacteria group bacterium]
MTFVHEDESDGPVTRRSEGGLMSLQGSNAYVRLIVPESATDGMTHPGPGDELVIRMDSADGVFLQIERHGMPLHFRLSEAHVLDRYPLRTHMLATRILVTHLAGLISLLTGFELVCVSDQQTSWRYVFREP